MYSTAYFTQVTNSIINFLSYRKWKSSPRSKQYFDGELEMKTQVCKTLYTYLCTKLSHNLVRKVMIRYVKDKENQGRRVKQIQKTGYTTSSHFCSFPPGSQELLLLLSSTYKTALDKGINIPIKIRAWILDEEEWVSLGSIFILIGKKVFIWSKLKKL